jgi:hypothetical protein
MEYATLVCKDLRIVANATAGNDFISTNEADLVVAIDQRHAANQKPAKLCPWMNFFAKEAINIPWKGFPKRKQDAIVPIGVVTCQNPDTVEVVERLVFET